MSKSSETFLRNSMKSREQLGKIF